MKKILIVGLGNPTSKLLNTYHSIGFKLINNLSRFYDIPFDKDPSCNVNYSVVNPSIHLCKSNDYMNVCGKSINRYFNKIQADRLLVLHDDLQRNFGKISPKQGGSANGHNGLKSISNHFKEGLNFDRIRIGIGRPDNKDDVASYVLTQMTDQELEMVDSVIFKNVLQYIENEYYNI